MTTTRHRGEGPLFVGIDSGSWNTKAALIAADASVLATVVDRSGADLASAASSSYRNLLQRAGIEEVRVSEVWATPAGSVISCPER
jgi:activator of 2-hydroxyglutaryl-CoA dehydratase